MDIRRENFGIIQISPLKPNQITLWDRLTLKRSEKNGLNYFASYKVFRIDLLKENEDWQVEVSSKNWKKKSTMN